MRPHPSCCRRCWYRGRGERCRRRNHALDFMLSAGRVRRCPCRSAGDAVSGECTTFASMPRLRFDFPGPDGTPCCRVIERPVDVLRADSIDQVVAGLRAAEAAARAGCWVAGYLSYEAAPAFDRALETHEPGRLPLLWLGIFDRVRDVTSATS